MSSQQNSTVKILHLLKMKGPQTAKTLAENLTMTSMGARQHLLQLLEHGLSSTPYTVVVVSKSWRSEGAERNANNK